MTGDPGRASSSGCGGPRTALPPGSRSSPAPRQHVSAAVRCLAERPRDRVDAHPHVGLVFFFFFPPTWFVFVYLYIYILKRNERISAIHMQTLILSRWMVWSRRASSRPGLLGKGIPRCTVRDGTSPGQARGEGCPPSLTTADTALPSSQPGPTGPSGKRWPEGEGFDSPSPKSSGPLKNPLRLCPSLYRSWERC